MIAELAGALAALIWLYLLLGRGMFWRLREADLTPFPRDTTQRVAVIIPARNESEAVGRATASLLQQDYPGPVRVFLADDHSTDGTPEAAARAARQLGRSDTLTLVQAGPLPDGWTGKLWAVAEGVRAAGPFQPDYLLFSDADIVHSAESLSSLVARAADGDYDLVSHMVKLRCETFAEKATIPAFLFFFFKLYPPAWTASAQHKTAGAAGGCILMRSAALARIGGIAAIRGELIDDCALAKAVKQAGGRIWLGLTSKTRSVRRYGTFAEIERMIARTAFWQLKHSVLLLLGTLAGMFVTYLLPPLVLLTGRPLPAALGALAWLVMMITYVPALRFYARSAMWAPLLPLVALFYMAATLHSAVEYWTGRGGMWKGRIQDRKTRGAVLPG